MPSGELLPFGGHLLLVSRCTRRHRALSHILGYTIHRQACWCMQESELTPTGANLLDGRYAVFGYVVDGADLLQECQVGDVVEYIKVTDGLQYLQQPVPHPKSNSGAI